MNDLISKLKTSLQSRRINFNIYDINQTSIVLISSIRGKKLSISLAHLITKDEDGNYYVSDYDKEYKIKGSNGVNSRVLTLIRKAEMAFNKHAIKL